MRTLIPLIPLGFLLVTGVACKKEPRTVEAPPAAEATAATAATPATPAKDATKPPASSAPKVSLKCPEGAKLGNSPARGQATRYFCLDAEGHLQGPTEVVRKDGSRVERGAYRDDKQHGAFSRYDAADKKVVTGRYEDDRLVEATAVVLDDKSSVKALEALLRDEIQRSASCEKTADCAFVGSICPFGCNTLVNKDEADRVRGLLNSYPAPCEYKCAAGPPPACIEGRCEASHHPAPEPTR